MARQMETPKKQTAPSMAGFAIFLLVLACIGFVWGAFEIMSMRWPL